MFFNEIKEFTTVRHFVGKENAQKVVKNLMPDGRNYCSMG